MPLLRNIGRIGYAQPADYSAPIYADGYDYRIPDDGTSGNGVSNYDPVIPVSYTPLPYLNPPAETVAPPPDTPGAPVDVTVRPVLYTTNEKPNILPVPVPDASADLDWTILLSLGAVFFAALSGNAVKSGAGKVVPFVAGLGVLYWKLSKNSPAVPVIPAQ